MRSILFINKYQDKFSDTVSKEPAALSNLVDRPFIFHVIDSLVKNAVKKIHLIESSRYDSIEQTVGEGERWGIEISYHKAVEGQTIPDVLEGLNVTSPSEKVVIGFARSIPDFANVEFATLNEDKTYLFDINEKEWSEWSIIPASLLKRMPSVLTPEEFIFLLGDSEVQNVSVRNLLSVRSLNEVHKTNLSLLKKHVEGIFYPTTAYEAEPGIWLSRNVVIHPTARLLAPVYIGENCLIGCGAVIGPDAMVEKNCLVDRGTQVKNSLICHDTYAGVGLEINNSIVKASALINTQLETILTMQDDFILSGLKVNGISNRMKRFLQQISGNVRSLLLSTAPQ